MKGKGAGKGDLPRQGQYSARSIAAFTRGYERAFGRECKACRGRGYYWDEDQNKNMVKHNCLICKGTGRIKSRGTGTTVVHGHTRKGEITSTFRSWDHMMSRCTNEKDEHYKNYGGRGVVVCGRWLKFENFLEDMGERPEGLTLDRIDNDGNYEPSNCKWSTHKEQCRNKRQSHLLTHGGQTHCITEWAEILGVCPATLFSRLKLGWSTEKILTQPVRQKENQR